MRQCESAQLTAENETDKEKEKCDWATAKCIGNTHELKSVEEACKSGGLAVTEKEWERVCCNDDNSSSLTRRQVRVIELLAVREGREGRKIEGVSWK